MQIANSRYNMADSQISASICIRAPQREEVKGEGGKREGEREKFPSFLFHSFPRLDEAHRGCANLYLQTQMLSCFAKVLSHTQECVKPIQVDIKWIWQYPFTSFVRKYNEQWSGKDNCPPEG